MFDNKFEVCPEIEKINIYLVYFEVDCIFQILHLSGIFDLFMGHIAFLTFLLIFRGFEHSPT